jgi:hypothetical protein
MTRTRIRRALPLIGIMVIAALLAFPLRDTIYQAVVIPVAYIAWELSLFYHAFGQITWWWLSIVIVLIMVGLSLAPKFTPRRASTVKLKPKHGQVEDLAIWLGRARTGTYFKWLIANRLGKLAYQMLLDRESGRPRSVFAPLLGLDWEPSNELRRYLETGLHGSFSDFPQPRRWRAVPPATPLDYDVNQAVEFLEAQVQNGQAPQSR